MLNNYHTHSTYCDGKAELEDFVIEAIKKGLSQIGFSGHSPLPFDNNFSIKRDKYKSYCDEVRRLKDKYSSDIKVLLGLEMDYIPGISDDFSELIKEGQLDYHIGSIHLINRNKGNDLWMIDGSRVETYDEGLEKVFSRNIKEGVRAFYHQTNEMIISQKPSIIGHINKIEMNNKGRYFQSDEKWYLDLVNETLDLVKESGCICEINTRGIYKGRYPDFYPSKDIMKMMKTRNIPVVAASDAHKPEEIDLLLEDVYEYLEIIEYGNICREIF